MGGKSTPQTQTTQYVLSPEQRELLDLAMPHLREFGASKPTLPGFSTVAEFDPLQTQGQEMALGVTGTQADVTGAAAGGNRFLSSGEVLRPESNPALQGAIDASVRPILEQFTTATLPAIRSAATGAGQFGSSRQGIAEGLAASATARAVGDTSAKVANQGYQAGLEAMAKGQAISPAIAGSQTIPATTVSGVGDVRQALQQALLGERAGRHTYEQTLPLMMGKELAGVTAGIPGASTTTTASTPKQNPLNTVLGGAMTLLPFFL